MNISFTVSASTGPLSVTTTGSAIDDFLVFKAAGREEIALIGAAEEKGRQRL